MPKNIGVHSDGYSLEKEMALPKFGKWGKENCVAKIIIGENSQFDKKSWFAPDLEVIIYYYVSVE